MIFARKLFSQLECYFVENCSTYDAGNVFDNVSVVLSYLPAATYIIVGWRCWYDHTLTNFVLSSGLMGAWFVSTIMYPFACPGGECLTNGTTTSTDMCGFTTGTTPSGEAALLFFVAVFVCVIEFHRSYLRRYVVAMRVFELLVLYAGLGSLAQVKLGLYSFTEVVIGSAIGTAVGILCGAVYMTILLPHFHSTLVQALLRLFCINRQVPEHDYVMMDKYASRTTGSYNRRRI